MLVTLFLMGYVVPRFSSIYEDVGTDLPLASRLLLQWGQLLEAHTMAVIAVGGGGCRGSRLRHYHGRSTRAALGAWIARFRRSAGSSPLSAGASVSHHRHAAARRHAGGHGHGHVVRAARETLRAPPLPRPRRRCAKVSRSPRRWSSNGLTTPVAARMLRVGERSGNMGEMMERIAAFCDEELARWVAVVTRLIEPLLMTVIGLIIGVIVVLMYFPIFQLAGSIR